MSHSSQTRGRRKELNESLMSYRCHHAQEWKRRRVLCGQNVQDLSERQVIIGDGGDKRSGMLGIKA